MGSDNNGLGKTVPCLVAVRWVVATAVGVIAFAVVVMVIRMVRRPEEIQITIDGGRIDVDGIRSNASAEISAFITMGNPSGRGNNQIVCTNMTVGLVDVQRPPAFQLPADVAGELAEAVNQSVVILNSDGSITLPKESWHTEQMVKSIDNGQLDYVMRRSSKDRDFEVLVLVNLAVSPRDASRSTTHYTFYCWPVSVSIDDSKPADAVGLGNVLHFDARRRDVDCKKMAYMEVPKLGHFPAPAPAPSPTS